MDNSVLAILLLALGLALLVAEIFIPSGGILLALTAITLVFALICAYSAWWESNRTFWWTYLGLIIFLIPGVIVGAFAILPRTSFGKMILAVPPSAEEVTPFAQEQEQLRAIVGKRGTTVNLLTPGGIVMIDGERMHAESEGMLIEPGEDVRVVDIRGNRLVVRRLTEKEKMHPPEETQTAQPDDSRLDFDVSES